MSAAEQDWAHTYDPDWSKRCAACHRQDAIEQAERDVLDLAAQADIHERCGNKVEAANFNRAAETYAWHYKRLVAGEWP